MVSKDLIGNLFLSEAVNLDDIEEGKLNIINAPTGCGKSYFALNQLIKLVSEKYKYLYVIDTINNKEQKLKDINTAPCSEEWISGISFNSDTSTIIGKYECFDEDKIVVITYAKLGKILIRNPNFGELFEVIVCDELHNGVKFSSWSEEDNITLKAIEHIKQLVINSKVKIIALTATPNHVEKYFKGLIKQIPVHKDIRQYEIYQSINYSNINALLESLGNGQRGIIYHQKIRSMQMICDCALKAGIKAISVWSINNKENPMTNEQLRVRDYIIENEGIPPEYDMIIINASFETGVNILKDKSKLDYIVVHNTNKDIQEQVRGRYRNDLHTLYILSDNCILDVPDKYLNTMLFSEEKKELCAYFSLRNKSYNRVGFPTLKVKLEDQGYTVLEGDRYRKNNKRYCIIQKP